ncbi:hypothetical protein B4N89_12080 [Embleya scabrispora]|uniref:Uncharacterized protein n=2 Tax=Embleya scabrispora TaxID=159449 RepID=A0A1T3NXL0_9ACTN|nr:hypothetical protein B4N89_12080 [Embleya scabrispora]
MFAAFVARNPESEALETLMEWTDLPEEEIVERIAQSEPYIMVLVAAGLDDTQPGVDVSHLNPRWLGEPGTRSWLAKIGFVPDRDAVRVYVVPAPYEPPAGRESHTEFCFAVEDRWRCTSRPR